MIRYGIWQGTTHVFFQKGNTPVIVGSNQSISKCCECHGIEEPLYCDLMQCYWCGLAIDGWHDCPKFIVEYVKWRLGIQQNVLFDGYGYD